MSKNDIVMVRERLSEIAHRDSAVSVTVRADDLRAILVWHHQSEPVALPERLSAPGNGVWHPLVPRHLVWNACLDEIAKLGLLFTHVDSGEVESTPECFCVEHGLHIETLRAKLAERDALLRGYQSLLRQVMPCLAMSTNSQAASYMRQIDVALSASAEPSAPVIHPINMKTIMQAYEQVDHKALLHGTSNWCALMATALRGVIHSEPSAPVERDEISDKQRLDSIEKFGFSISATKFVGGFCGPRGREWLVFKYGCGFEVEGETLREALDKARAALERKP